MEFRELLYKNTPRETLNERRLRYQLADACLEHFSADTASGRAIYAALSHLSKVPELEVNMAHYDNLMFVDNALVAPEVYYFAISKLRELGELIDGSI